MLDWEPLYPIAVYVLAGLAIVCALVAARWMAVSPKTRFWPLFLLRAGVLATLLAILLNPIDQRETELPPNPPTVALVVDCSQSMGLGTDLSRLETVKRMIGSTTGRIQSEREIELPLFRFGDRLARVPGITELDANDESSSLSDALQRLPARIVDNETRAVVLFSDGAVSDEDRLAELSTAYRDEKTPLYTMLAKQEEMRGDIAITELSVPQKVSKGDQATVRATIESLGFDNERTVVSVRRADQPQGTPVASIPITLRSGPTVCELVVEADPDLGDLAIDVPVMEGESVDKNNRIRFQLTERPRGLKVLYMEGTAGREYSWLQDALQADPDIKCVAMTVNNQYARRPRLQRVDDSYRGYPTTRAELFEYDVVICSDISYMAFTPEQIEWTVDLVAKRGGGFVMVGGYTSFGAGGWDRTPWEGLIPFDMTGQRDVVNSGFSVTVPESAQSHPIWRLVDDDRENRAALAAMPAFGGTNLISRVKPAATLLGETSRQLSSVGIMPVFACETYGRGRTFAMSTDTTIGWGARFERSWGRGDNRYYAKFWRNVIRWLAENSQASQKRLVVRTDQVIYSPDDEIDIVAEAYDAQFQPTTDYRITAHLTNSTTASSNAGDDEPSGSEDEYVTMSPNPATDQYSASISAKLPASMDDRSSPMQTAQLVVTAWQGDKRIARNLTEIQLLHRSKEWLRPQAKPENLRLVANNGGGKLLESEEQLADLLRSIEVAPGEVLVHKLPAWDHWALWSILLGLLGIDWTLRRRSPVA